MKTTTRPARIRRRILAVGIPVITLLAGVGIGTSSTTAPVEPRVETEVVTETVEVEKLVEVVPSACLTALDNAEALNEINIEAFGVVADMFDAASVFDTVGIDAGSAKLDALAPRVGAAVDAYNEEADECRAY